MRIVLLFVRLDANNAAVVNGGLLAAVDRHPDSVQVSEL
jgi:hypothetical protein